MSTVITTLTDVQFQQRLAALLPPGWAGEDAVQTGLMGALLRSLGGGLSFLTGEIQYTQLATRLTTETAPELDLASQDFFGDALPRPAGMSDANFASLIISNLFKTAATRPAIAAALERLTGQVPRMLEPWNIFDTGTWDRTSYWDADTVTTPARWGDGSQLYQGYIETPVPAIPLLGVNNPILGWDSPAFWDVAGYFFADLASNIGENAYSLVNRLKAEGTTVFLKIVAPAATGPVLAPGPPIGIIVSSLGPTSLMVVWTAPVIGTGPFTYQVQYRQTGTVNFFPGPQTIQTAAILSNLVANVEYDVRVVATNAAGSATSAIATGTTGTQAPSPATNLVATLVQATAVTLQWTAPATGTPPFTYTVQYRVSGTIPFSQFAVGAGATAVTVINLQPSTTYDFEVVTSN